MRLNSARIKKEVLSLALMLVAGGIFYVGLQSLHTFNGKRAFTGTGLTPLTLAEAMAQAQAEGKPILADFSAFWCGFCIKLNKTVFSDSRVKKAIDQKYIYARIDSESDEADNFRKTYNAFAFPTVLILNADGSEQKRIKITFVADEFLQQI
jgi:thiol:disulfide interchange protein